MDADVDSKEHQNDSTINLNQGEEDEPGSERKDNEIADDVVLLEAESEPKTDDKEATSEDDLKEKLETNVKEKNPVGDVSSVRKDDEGHSTDDIPLTLDTKCDKDEASSQEKSSSLPLPPEESWLSLSLSSEESSPRSGCFACLAMNMSTMRR